MIGKGTLRCLGATEKYIEFIILCCIIPRIIPTNGLASKLTVFQMGKVEHHNCDSGSKLSFNRGPNKFFTCWCSLHIS